jgi:hypothetical protein
MTKVTDEQLHAAIREDGQRLGDAALVAGDFDICIALAIVACAAEHLINTVDASERAELLADWLASFGHDA